MAKESANDRFRRGAGASGFEPDIIRFPEDTRTAEQAATAVGCELAQIVKSLIFSVDDEAVLVLTSGANRVSTAKLEALLAAPVGRADARQVRAATGFAIGGVPPFGHVAPVQTIIDRDLGDHETVYGAAGTPDTVFPIGFRQLAEVTGGQVADIAE